MEKDTSEYFVQIIENHTGNKIEEIGPYSSERMAERAERGVLRNLNRDRYFTYVVSSS